jgi:hypothetical protein
MKSTSMLISHLVHAGHLHPESGAVLRDILRKMTLNWDIDEKDRDRLSWEIPKSDTSNAILHKDNLRGKFLELAPYLAARLVLEQARNNRPNYQQSLRVYSLYMKLCEIYHFDRNCC